VTLQRRLQILLSSDGIVHNGVSDIGKVVPESVQRPIWSVIKVRLWRIALSPLSSVGPIAQEAAIVIKEKFKRSQIEGKESMG
jgi:hypothetical protein